MSKNKKSTKTTSTKKKAPQATSTNVGQIKEVAKLMGVPSDGIDHITKAIEEPKPTPKTTIPAVTVSGAVKLMGIGPARIRQIINTYYKDGSIKIRGQKDSNGDWMISIPSIQVWKKKKLAREAKRQEKIDELVSGDYKYPYTRPRVQSIQMIQRALSENGKKVANTSETQVVLTVLARIEKIWDKEYKNRNK